VLGQAHWQDFLYSLIIITYLLTYDTYNWHVPQQTESR